MAEVFRAVLPGAEGFKRTFVLKRILSHLSRSPKFVAMFIREARTVAMLNHPNIVQVYDFGNIDGTYFLAMEYLRGRDLLAILRRLRDVKAQLPIPVAAHIAHQVARGLAYAHALHDPEGHELDIVHRDVSPSNIMCMRTGEVKLLDFGIAKTAAECMSEHTDEGTMKGKLAYMAPERVQNEAFDARSDVYSLGVVLWEMLTRKQLFRGKSMVEVIKQVMEQPIAPPSSVRPEVPSALDAIALRALARDPAMRFATTQAMADQLEEAVRATSYQTRMLPDLIYDLFGSGLQSSQIAMSGVTPELLAAAGASEIATNGGSYRTAFARRTRWWRRRSWPVAVGAAAALTIFAIAVLLALRPGGTRVEVSQPAAQAAPALAAPPAATPKTLTTVAADPAPVVPEKPSEPPPSKIKKGAVKRAKGAPGNNTNNPIADGLSIDPFAEAATRGQK